jgi:hypothetical protein
VEEGVHGVTLQTADFDGLLVVAMIDAGTFAENIHGTDARATGAENVGVEDGKRGAAEIALGDLFDEARNVNVGGTGRGAGSVEAVEAPVGFGEGGLMVEGRMKVRETNEEVGMRLVLVECAHIILAP